MTEKCVYIYLEHLLLAENHTDALLASSVYSNLIIIHFEPLCCNG